MPIVIKDLSPRAINIDVRRVAQSSDPANADV